jgi:hypothetical protein
MTAMNHPGELLDYNFGLIKIVWTQPAPPVRIEVRDRENKVRLETETGAGF